MTWNELLSRYLWSVWELTGELWLLFLIGFLAAGLVAEFIPSGMLVRYMGRNSLATLLRATLSGTVASLCSCGAIPVAVTMRKGGASQAAALTFMLAAPWAGFMQLLVFYRFLGLPGAMVVFFSALGVALATGLILGRLEDGGWLSSEREGVGQKNPRYASGADSHLLEEARREPLHARLLEAVKEASQAFRELWKYLTIGLLLAALLKAFVPEAWVTDYLGSNAPWNPVLTALPVAAAVELCSEGFSIFAGQLHRMGAGLAVILVVVLVGVATDFTELSVIWGRFGKRTTVAYLITATLLSVFAALLIQYLTE